MQDPVDLREIPEPLRSEKGLASRYDCNSRHDDGEHPGDEKIFHGFLHCRSAEIDRKAFRQLGWQIAPEHALSRQSASDSCQIGCI